MESEDAIIKAENKEEAIKYEVEDGYNPENTSEVSQQRDFYIEDSAQLSENVEALILNCGHNLRSTSKYYSRDHHVYYTLLPCSELHTLLSDKQGRVDSKLRGQGFQERSHAKTNGHRVITVSPRYNQYKDAWDTNVSVEIKVGDKIETVRFFHCYKRGVDRVFVDHPIFLEKVKSVTGSKILRILKSHGLAPEIPEDLYHLIKQAVAIRKHLERNKKDKDSKFRLILV
ncbi:hypothetical protein GIB67_026559 [Kingdonia uniflora]|uniref:Starch synthase catalytic domain-containing protein n=1 Tax=Kingdonia uniflora TaxID=39325 RepID=A0A7J7PC60_9MAGN|nr:hypothetical protein GIB67_026559 [Kingdonia uniflora]